MQLLSIYIRNNLKFYKARNFLIVLIIFLASFSYLLSSNVGDHFSMRLERASQMLGADIIIAPTDVNPEIEKALFNGNPTTVYSDSKKINSIKDISGVKSVEEELLISTIDADCCDSKLQVIALDFDNDFIIHPWIESDVKRINENDIIVGSDVSYNCGDNAFFYGKEYKVVGKLKPTNMGYDTSVFVSMREGFRLLKKSDVFSVALVTVDADKTSSSVVNIINKKLQNTGLKAYKNDDFYSSC